MARRKFKRVTLLELLIILAILGLSILDIFGGFIAVIYPLFGAIIAILSELTLEILQGALTLILFYLRGRVNGKPRRKRSKKK